jgi:hypothetical protein
MKLVDFITCCIGTFVSLLVSATAVAACPDYANRLGTTETWWIYAGYIGTHPIRMVLHYDEGLHRFVGEYGYGSQPHTLKVTGAMLQGSTQFGLNEYDADGVITGQFDLAFSDYPARWVIKSRMSEYDCMYIDGKWKSSNGNVIESVRLFQGNPLSMKDDEDRKSNEATAYELQKAILHNEPDKVAVLIHYPFYWTDNMNHSIISYSQSEVVKNYKKIMDFPLSKIRDAVPHELDTVSGHSSFIDNHVCLAQGKVIYICHGGCRCQ